MYRRVRAHELRTDPFPPPAADRDTAVHGPAAADALTGLANRTQFLDRLRTIAAAGRPLAVLFLDLDDFKLVNDGWGHDTGDHLLCEVAKRLRAAVRPGDLVARLGGDEFTVLCEGVSGEREALAGYAAFSDAHAPFYRRALRLQRLIPALPPRALTALLAVMGRERPCRRAFTWYLDQAHPRIAQHSRARADQSGSARLRQTHQPAA